MAFVFAITFTQPNATVAFKVTLIVERQHNFGVRCDVHGSKWSKVDGRGLIGAGFDRCAAKDRRAGRRTQTVDLDRLIVTGG